MPENRKFSEVLEEYISACLAYRQADKEMDEILERNHYWRGPTQEYTEASERKEKLAKELDSFIKNDSATE